MSDAQHSKAQQLVGAFRCECGTSTEWGDFYPCDSEGRRLECSDLVYCAQCDRITVRETGQVFGYRSLVLSACACW
jgi:hypothetical protein